MTPGKPNETDAGSWPVINPSERPDPAQKRRELAERLWKEANRAYYAHKPGSSDRAAAIAAIERVLAESEGK